MSLLILTKVLLFPVFSLGCSELDLWKKVAILLPAQYFEDVSNRAYEYMEVIADSISIVLGQMLHNLLSCRSKKESNRLIVLCSCVFNHVIEGELQIKNIHNMLSVCIFFFWWEVILIF
jgi:hypothetical protein